jgi:hypothetical protein
LKTVEMAGTTLTQNGWSGASRGTWNNRANVVVDTKGGIRTSGSDLIDALKGNDEIRGSQKNNPGVIIPRGRQEGEKRGNLQLGDDNDTIIGTSNRAPGIDNRGFIFTGAGQDLITGEGTSGIRNRGFIFTQRDDDVVDVRKGGVRGGGFIDLGGGRNTFIGFGDHRLYAGGVDKDLLLLPKGTYTIRRGSKRRYRVEKGNRELELFDFDQIGSIEGSRRDRITLDKSGTLVVRDNGSINFS